MVKLNSKVHMTKDGVMKRNPAKKAINRELYQKTILNGIDDEDYEGNALKTSQAKLKFLKKRFESEYGHEIRRKGYQGAMAEWYQGLAIDIPYYNSDIIELAKKGGSLPQNATESQEYKLLDNYWNFMANETLKMFRKYKVD